MTTYDASLDYWSVGSIRPITKYATNNVVEEMFEVEIIKEIVSLEELTFKTPGFFRRFDKSHPGLLWFLLVNTLLAPILVYANFQIVPSQASTVFNALMVSSGAKTLSADNLVTLVKSNNRLTYWIKSVPGDMYSNNSTQDGVNSISYIPSNAKLSDLRQVDLTVKTYKNFAIYTSQLQPLVGPNETMVTTATGTIVEFNKGFSDRMIVSFTKKPEIVVVQYPTTQDVTTLMRDARSLVPIN